MAPGYQLLLSASHMSVSGMCIALSSALVYNKKTAVLSNPAAYLNGIFLNSFIFDQNPDGLTFLFTSASMMREKDDHRSCVRNV